MLKQSALRALATAWELSGHWNERARWQLSEMLQHVADLEETNDASAGEAAQQLEDVIDAAMTRAQRAEWENRCSDYSGGKPSQLDTLRHAVAILEEARKARRAARILKHSGRC